MPYFYRGSTALAPLLTVAALATVLLLPSTTSAQSSSFRVESSAPSPFSSTSIAVNGTSVTSAAELPDAPEPQNATTLIGRPDSKSMPAHAPRFAPPPRAPLYNKYIEPAQTAQPLLGFERKLTFGAAQIISPYFVLSAVSSAGYEQLVNGSPNYGTDSGAYGQRLGAAAIRISSDSIFTDGLMPALFHQDPRFYVMGKGHSGPARGVHAVIRVFVTRSDAGEHQANYSLFAGHAATAALENAYYPSNNRGVTETAKSFGESLSGTALSNVIREFFPDLLHLAHLE